MASEREVQVYTVPQVAEMVGMSKHMAYDLLDKGEFPFPVLRIGERNWVVPKKPVDMFLEKGYQPRYKDTPWSNYLGKTKWVKKEYANYNYKIPVDLHRRFTEVCRNQNKTLASPLSKGEWLRVALEEFVQRRPEFLSHQDDEASSIESNS